MTYEQTYAAFFGSKRPAELVAEFMEGKEDGLPEWLGEHVRRVLHMPGEDAGQRAALAQAALTYWEAMLSEIGDAVDEFVKLNR